MAIEAPLSKHKKNNYKIYIGVCVIAAVWFGYDGYVSKKFKATHTQDGKPDSTLVFNRWAPPFFIAAAVLLGVYLYKIRDRKMVAEQNELIISDKERIPYDSIQKIDKTHFQSKLESTKPKREFLAHPGEGLQEVKEEVEGEPTGYFIITYKNKYGREVSRKLSDRNYDNLTAILDHLVAKIS
jgi:hypothetical protein